MGERRGARLDSIDLLRGFVMVVMALDHTRDWWANARFDPTDLTKTTPALFATRWITHLCAPAFVLLAGVGAALSLERGKTRGELSRYLLTRGLWLVVLELTIVRFGFTSYVFWTPTLAVLLVIWALGVSMIVLAGLVYLPPKVIAILALVMIAGHNTLDGIDPASWGSLDWLWQVLHVQSPIELDGFTIYVGYPLIPWIGVMALGYAAGRYLVTVEPAARPRLFVRTGIALVLAFVVLRATNVYGDLYAWEEQKSTTLEVLAFLNVTKYPPSLQYLCVTLGICALLLALFERWRPSLLLVFGRVPLFYYVLHLLLISNLALVAFRLQHGEWLSRENRTAFAWGFSLPVVYAAWIGILALLYVPCRWFAGVKARRRDWWLGYL